ncbi:hypothetical protein KY290_028291 [Solanum tuberosum]|uniref:Transposase n=1 Tax=Solanum tuberosum TaxID=4113 RepID=A0ABQ7UHX0_SOLTU|nr:hypothetical protein KY290_028291 [Solanum tuberosum]
MIHQLSCSIFICSFFSFIRLSIDSQMENTAGTDVEMIINSPLVVSIPQKKGKSTPHLRTPPKKQKRTTPIDSIPTDGNTGKETSQIWDHFAKFIAKGGKRRAKYNYCVKHFAAETKTNGTSVLWSHLNDKCLKSPFRFVDRRQTTLKAVPIKVGGQENGTSSIENVVYNVEDIRRAIAEFVIIDEQPFKVVEGEGFKKLMAKALPNFELPSWVTVARHCLKIYQEEKEKLKKLVKNQHICITSDTWTSLQNLTYKVVTAHWIDDEWNLQKKILNFFQTPDHKGETIAKGIEACLLDWEIENLFTVTLDNASANDSAIKHLKARIDDWKGVILRNEFLHVRCNAYILNIIVKEGLDEQIEPISRIRNAVKYVKSSASRFASFKSYVEKTKLDTHILMLKLGSFYVTSNIFFHEFFNVRSSILKYSCSEDLILIDMAGRMKVKFDKYWENIEKPENLNMLLFIAIVLDPRYKTRYVNFILSKAYGFLLGKLKANNVEGVLKRLYNHYNYSSIETFANNIGDDTNMMGEVDDILHSQWEKHLEDEENIGKKSELDQYLMDNVEKPKDFNILTWWKASSNRYPTISKMARDVLSIPVSTVASESAFSTGGRILDSYRSSLSPKTVEALIFTQQWIRSPSKEWKVQDYLEEVQKIEEVEKECPGAPLSID